MVGREDHRARRDRADARAPRRAVHANDARQRQDPGRQADAADRARRPRPVPRREVDRLGRRRVARRRALDERAQLAEVARFGERAFVDARLKRVLERHHQLDALERAQPELLERRRRRQIVAARRTSRPAPRARRCPAARAAARRRRSSPSRGSPRASACACLRCAAARAPARPARAGSSGDRRAARSPARTTASASMPGSRTSTACTRSLRSDRHADDRRVAHAGDRVQHALDVLRKDVQPFGRDDHFLLAAADEQLAVGADLADVAGVEPAVLERARRFLVGVEVAAS